MAVVRDTVRRDSGSEEEMDEEEEEDPSVAISRLVGAVVVAWPVVRLANPATPHPY